MAIINGKYLRGILGPLVFSVQDGQQKVSVKKTPGTIKQTAATKKAGRIFGLASKLGSLIRLVLQPLVKGFQDKTMHSRLAADLCLVLSSCRNPDTGMFNFAEYSFSTVEGFEFNRKSPLRKSLGITPAVNLDKKVLKVAFPEGDAPIGLRFPRQATHCEIKMGLLLLRLDKSLMQQWTEWRSIVVDRADNVLNGKQFSFKVPAGCLCIVSLFLRYYQYTQLLNNKQFSPAGICGARISPGQFKAGGGHFRVNMPDLKIPC